MAPRSRPHLRAVAGVLHFTVVANAFCNTVPRWGGLWQLPALGARACSFSRSGARLLVFVFRYSRLACLEQTLRVRVNPNPHPYIVRAVVHFLYIFMIPEENCRGVLLKESFVKCARR